MATAAIANRRGQILASSRRAWSGTPEVYFSKAIDNSRLVKVADVRRSREMAQFALALGIFFLVVMFYAWQHFSAIEYGYRIETLKAQRDSLSETASQLKLEMASLKNPERIDVLARDIGLRTAQPGQVQRMNPAEQDTGGPVIARATEVAVVSAP